MGWIWRLLGHKGGVVRFSLFGHPNPRQGKRSLLYGALLREVERDGGKEIK